MSDNQNWKNLGDQILGTVSEALNSGDFNSLNQLVNDTVNSAVQDAKMQALKEKEKQMERVTKARADFLHEQEILKQKEAARQANWKKQQEDEQQREQERRQQWQQGQQWQPRRQEKAGQQGQFGQSGQPGGATRLKPGEATVVRRTPKDIKNIRFHKVGNVAGILFSVFGGIGLGIGVTALLTLGILTVVLQSGVLGVLTGCSALLSALSINFLCTGNSLRDRIGRAERYVKLCGDKTYIAIQELARQTGKSTRYIKKDLKKMIRKGFFPEGHFDAQETCLILDDSTYQQYTQTAEAFKMREQLQKQEEEAKKALALEKEQMTEEQKRDAELNSMITEGKECIRKLRDLNDRIPDENLSEDLFRLENLLNEIFDNLREHPNQMHRMHKMMDYYLPTTLKLVEAYEGFDKVSMPGEDIKNAKMEIEKTLGIINDAFLELQNNLFQEAAFDATTDAQVLQSMLAREGLTKEPAFAFVRQEEQNMEMKQEQHMEVKQEQQHMEMKKELQDM